MLRRRNTWATTLGVLVSILKQQSGKHLGNLKGFCNSVLKPEALNQLKLIKSNFINWITLVEIPSSPQELPGVLQPLTFYCLYCHADDARFHPEPASFPWCLPVGACSPPATPKEKQARAGAPPRLPSAPTTQTQTRPRRHLREAAPLTAAGWFCQTCKVRVYKRYRLLWQEK